MNQYELMLLAPAGWDSDAYAALRNKVEGWIGDGKGKTVEFKDLGERELAYGIDRRTRSRYMLWWFDGPSSLPGELKARFVIEEDIVRHMIVVREKMSINEITSKEE